MHFKQKDVEYQQRISLQLPAATTSIGDVAVPSLRSIDDRGETARRPGRARGPCTASSTPASRDVQLARPSHIACVAVLVRR